MNCLLIFYPLHHGYTMKVYIWTCMSMFQRASLPGMSCFGKREKGVRSMAGDIGIQQGFFRRTSTIMHVNHWLQFTQKMSAKVPQNIIASLTMYILLSSINLCASKSKSPTKPLGILNDCVLLSSFLTSMSEFWSSADLNSSPLFGCAPSSFSADSGRLTRNNLSLCLHISPRILR